MAKTDVGGCLASGYVYRTKMNPSISQSQQSGAFFILKNLLVNLLVSYHTWKKNDLKTLGNSG